MSATPHPGGDEPDDADHRRAIARDHIRVNAIPSGPDENAEWCSIPPAGGEATRPVMSSDVRARDAQVPMGHMGDAWDVATPPVSGVR